MRTPPATVGLKSVDQPKTRRKMGTKLTGITSMATRHILEGLALEFSRRSGIAVSLTAMGGVEAQKRLREGIGADLVLLASSAIERLEAEGRLVRGSRTDYARSVVALAVTAGTRHPPVATVEEVRDAMLAARRVAYSTGPSGDHLEALWEAWGIARAMGPRALLAPPGVPVAQFLASGEADLGLQQYSELLDQPGIEILGPLPDEIQPATVFSGAIGATSKEIDAASAFLSFISSPGAAAAIRRGGMHPLQST
jgi:molybdate transport system substrate-binding protein